MRQARRLGVTWAAGADGAVAQEPGLAKLRFDDKGLVVAIVQHVDTGEILMQAFSDEAAVKETLHTG